jgi:hypothetical protein
LSHFYHHFWLKSSGESDTSFFWIIFLLLSKERTGPGDDIPTGEQGTISWRGNGMIGKKTLGLIGAVLMLLAAPLSAAEKTYQFDIPGCNS